MGTAWCKVKSDRIDHAWCERGSFVVDLTLSVGCRIIERELYYEAFEPQVAKTYAIDEALLLSVKNGHPGPWDESEQLK